jgi:hypothetical protein
MQSILPIVFMVIYLGIVIYLISMLGRFVRAIERIAAKIENSPKL